ncbi:MAG: PEGA domain-containing protein [Planctomycetota bacterium]|nr:MAG: PEGA domain-containing protein [Planctomycetota bacterium]
MVSSVRALEQLEEANLHGALTVSDGLVDVGFLFTRGGLRLVSAGRPLPSLAARLAEQGLLGAQERQQVEAIRAGRRRPPPDVDPRSERELLLGLRLGVGPEEVDGAARAIVGEAFLSCLFWPDPRYELTLGEPNPELLQRRDLSALTLSLGVKALIAEVKARVRAIGDVLRTVSDLRVVVEPTPAGREAVAAKAPLGEGPGAVRRARLLRAVVEEPGSSGRDLAARLRFSEVELASRVHELTTRGLLATARRPPDPEEELERIRAMEAGIDEALSQLLRRVRLADDSARLGDAPRAARHMARAGGLLLGAGRAEEALRTFQGALKYSEDDLEAREGYVQSLWGTRRDAEAATAAEELGRRYLELNLPTRARRVLERALGFQESASGLDLLVRSYVKLKKPKLAAEAGQRLVNRLRREGRAEEARELAAKLLQLGDDADRRKLLRAAGLDRRKVAALVVLGGVASLGFFPARAEEARRERYAALVRRLQGELGGVRDLRAARGAMTPAIADADVLAGEPGATGARARALAEDLRAVVADCERVAPLLAYLPWREQPDIDHVLARLRVQGEARSQALATPLKRLREELEAYRAAAQRAAAEVRALGPTADAYARAVDVRRRFANVPSVLRSATVAVELVSAPPGAVVRYGGTRYSQRTPLVLQVPLKGVRELRLSLEGHEEVRRQIDFAAIEPQRMRIELRLPPRPTAAQPRPRGRTRVSVSRTTPKPAPKRRPRPPQIELREGTFLGARGAAKKYVFESSPSYFVRGARALRLPARYRARVRPLNRVTRRGVMLVGIDVDLFVYRSRGWVRERTERIELDEPLQRPVVVLRDGRRRVRALRRTISLKEDELFDEVREALRDAMRAIKNKERSRRG